MTIVLILIAKTELIKSVEFVIFIMNMLADTLTDLAHGCGCCLIGLTDYIIIIYCEWCVCKIKDLAQSGGYLVLDIRGLFRSTMIKTST